MGALAEKQVIAEAEPRGQTRQALCVDDRGAQPGELSLVGGLIGMEEVFSCNQLENGVAQVFQPFVVRRPTFGMLVVV
jgi:hypothetical protein